MEILGWLALVLLAWALLATTVAIVTGRTISLRDKH
jgi:hypothetical protein